VTEWS